MRRLSLIPGVARVATAMQAPFVQYGMSTRLKTGTGALLQPQSTEVNSREFFETLGVPLVRGRLFSTDELGTNGAIPRSVVILSEQLAEALYGTQDPIGGSVEFNIRGRVGKRYEVIGVVADVRVRSLTGNPEPMIYEPADVSGPVYPFQAFLIRTNGDIELAAQVRAIAADLNRALPVTPLISMHDAVGRVRAEWDVLARLMITLAVLAGVLAMVGLYGVVAFGVAARRREYGIRLALGAPPAQVVKLVLRRTAVITAVGLALGCAGAFALARVLQSRLVGVTPFDPVVWTLAAAALIAMALLASWIPARRAVSVDVTHALRTT